MPNTSKIATCCYCGSRAALVLKGPVRHELACANCGAPLHEMKMLRSDAVGDRELVRPSPMRPAVRDPRWKSRGKPKKRQKSLSQQFMAHLRDAADDLLDDVFDVFD